MSPRKSPSPRHPTPSFISATPNQLRARNIAERAVSAGLQKQLDTAQDQFAAYRTTLAEQGERNATQARTIATLTAELADAKAATVAMHELLAFRATTSETSRLRGQVRALEEALDQRSNRVAKLAQATLMLATKLSDAELALKKLRREQPLTPEAPCDV